MALRKNTDIANTPKADATAAPAANFESQDEGGDTAVVEDEVSAPAVEAAAPEVVTSATRAVQAAASRALGSPLNKVNTVIEGLKDVISGDQLESMGFGVFPRITVGLDGFSIDKTKDLGKVIHIELHSWNYVWLVTTGEQNNSEADKLIRTSYDGVNLKGGEGTVADYVKHLKGLDYEKATSKQYVEMYANLVWSEEKGDVPVDEQVIHQISVSPQSVGKWGAYNLETKMRKLKGIADGNLITLTGDKKVLGNNKFGVITFSTTK
jgi:hypothetical protein